MEQSIGHQGIGLHCHLWHVDTSKHIHPLLLFGNNYMCAKYDPFFVRICPWSQCPTYAPNSKCGMGDSFGVHKVILDLYKILQHFLHLPFWSYSLPTLEPLSKSIEGVLL
jgi:hypothetical protein